MRSTSATNLHTTPPTGRVKLSDGTPLALANVRCAWNQARGEFVVVGSSLAEVDHVAAVVVPMARDRPEGHDLIPMPPVAGRARVALWPADRPAVAGGSMISSAGDTAGWFRVDGAGSALAAQVAGPQATQIADAAIAPSSWSADLLALTLPTSASAAVDDASGTLGAWTWDDPTNNLTQALQRPLEGYSPGIRWSRLCADAHHAFVLGHSLGGGPAVAGAHVMQLGPSLEKVAAWSLGSFWPRHCIAFDDRVVVLSMENAGSQRALRAVAIALPSGDVRSWTTPFEFAGSFPTVHDAHCIADTCFVVGGESVLGVGSQGSGWGISIGTRGPVD